MRGRIQWRNSVLVFGLVLFWVSVIRMLSGQYQTSIGIALISVGLVCIAVSVGFVGRKQTLYQIVFFDGTAKRTEYHKASRFVETRPEGAELTSVTLYPEKVTINNVILLREVPED